MASRCCQSGSSSGFTGSFEIAVLSSGEWVDVNELSGNPTNEMALVGMERGLMLTLKAVRTGIGAALRTLHSDALREEVPERMAELLRQLDQQKDADSA